MGKTPRIAFDRLCLPRNQGGLGVLHPSRHYMVLQMKWLFALFSNNDSHIRGLLTHHFALLQNTDDDPLFSFYSSEHRPLSTIHPTSVVHSLYKTFDYFDVHFALDQVPLHLLLRFSLRRMFVSVPSNHWLRRHPRVTASSFLRIHNDTGQLSIRCPGTFSHHPYLLFRLYGEVVAAKTIQL
ncbi:hypothetical protein EDC96DRAFT_452306, partial [Choanephora cucurbitarum]